MRFVTRGLINHTGSNRYNVTLIREEYVGNDETAALVHRLIRETCPNLHIRTTKLKPRSN